MAQTWLTADTQIQHEKTALSRGFESVEAHDAMIAAWWRKHVAPEDTVILAGDAHLGNVETAMDFYADLEGEKILVMGNHERCHPIHHNGHKHIKRYLRAFDLVVPFISLRHEGVSYVVSHFPYDGDNDQAQHEGDRHTWARMRDEGRPLIHGHVHAKYRHSLSERGTDQWHVGWDAWGRFPTLAEAVRHEA